MTYPGAYFIYEDSVLIMGVTNPFLPPQQLIFSDSICFRVKHIFFNMGGLVRVCNTRTQRLIDLWLTRQGGLYPLNSHPLFPTRMTICYHFIKMNFPVVYSIPIQSLTKISREAAGLQQRLFVMKQIEVMKNKYLQLLRSNDKYETVL